MTDFAVSADGTRIACETSGYGPPLVFVHGASGDRHVNPELRAALEQSFTVTTHDRRGRGDSEDADPYDFLVEAEDLRAVIAKTAGRPIVFGISMGARIALELLRNPPDLACMVLFEPPATDHVDEEFADRLHRVRNTLEAEGREAAVIMHSRLFHNRTEQDIEDLKRDRARWQLRVDSFPITLREMEAVHRDNLFDPDGYPRPPFEVHAMFGDATLPFLKRSGDLIGKLDFVNTRNLPGHNHSAPSEAPAAVLAALFSAVQPN